MRKSVPKNDLSRFIAILDLEKKISKSKKPKKIRSVSVNSLLSRINGIDERIRSEDWEGLTSGDLVALYAWCHNKLYDVVPTDLTGKNYNKAVFSVTRMVENEFNGDIKLAVDYMRWVWDRENSLIKYRKSNGIQSVSYYRITWYKLFVDKKFLVDYKVVWVMK